MKKIRVLHILDELNTGGAERIVFTYFQNIDHSKFQWDFVITRYADQTKKGMLEDMVESLGGRIFRVHRKRENYYKHIIDIDRIIREGNYDIVHSHLDELSAFYLKSAKKYGVKTRICHSHLSGAKRGKCVEIVCALLKPVMNTYTTDKFACGVAAARSLWGEKALDSGSVYIMKNAIDTKDFTFNQLNRKKIRDYLSCKTNTVLLGFVGRLSNQKNPEYVIEIFNCYHKLNPNSLLVLVGEGEKKDRLMRMVAEYGISDSVSFMGRRNDISQIMMGLDVFLLPSRFEGLPIVMVEAQSTGLECFVSDKITKEVSINENIHYLSIDVDPEIWTEEIMKKSITIDRTKAYNEVVKQGYEIRMAANSLSDYYIKAVETR